MSDDWQIGNIVLGQYEVLELLGEGAFGQVHRVRHLGWNMDMAVKSLRPDLAADPRHLLLFWRECEGWIDLGLHPNVVSCYYVRDVGGLPRIFSEFADGGTLEQRMQQGGNDLQFALDCAIQVLDGLAYAHGRGVVHRDVKPSNVLLSSDGGVHLSDFGLAAGLGGLSIPSRPSARHLTLLAGGICGTPAYLAPEAWLGQPTGPWTDLYAFFVTLYELCCGRHPYGEAADFDALRALHLEASPQPMGDGVPAKLQRLVARGLAREPSERFASCAEVRPVLLECYREVSGDDYPRDAPSGVRLQADALNNRAVSMLDLGEPTDAMKLLEQALALDPAHLQARYNRGLILWWSGISTDRDVVDALAATRFEGWEGWYMQGLVHRERGAADEANAAFARALEAAGDDVHVRTTVERAAAAVRDGLRPLPRMSLFDRLREQSIDSIALNPDGRLAAVGSDDQVMLLDLQSGDCLWGHGERRSSFGTRWSNYIRHVCFNGDRVYVSRVGTIEARSAASGEALHKLTETLPKELTPQR